MVVLIGGAVAVALIIAARAAVEQIKELPTAIKQPGDTPAPVKPPDQAGTETPTPKPPDETPTQPTEPPAPLDTREADAQDYLKTARAFEANPNAWITDKVAAYENVVKMYAGTQAAKEAQKAIDRLRRATETPAPETPEPEKPEPDDAPADP